MVSLSESLCSRVDEIKELDTKDREQVQNLILDFFAALFAGYKLNKKFGDNVKKIIFEQEGKAEATVFGSNVKLPARSAAFMNALYGHGAELDDGNKKAMGHIGVHVIPSVLALAEAEKKKLDEIMIAIVAGYETYIRISAAAQPGMVERSFHSTGMAGAPASAVACAKLLGLGKEKIESAMSLACTMSSGLLTYSESQQMIKPINPAKAAETGIFAARLAANGVNGPLNCLDGPNGWFNAVTDSYKKEIILQDCSHFLIHECYFKLYPSCRHTHCGIEAAINISSRVDVKNIQRVNVYIYPNAIKLAGQIRYPKNVDETKFSIHYTLACGLIYGEYSVDYMDPSKRIAEIKELIDKIELIPDNTMENSEKAIRGALIEVILYDGSVEREKVLVPKGDPENPMKLIDLEHKLKACSEKLISNTQYSELKNYICNFGGNDIIDGKKLFQEIKNG